MYPLGLVELILVWYGGFHLINDICCRKKNIEYIELTETQYNQVKNIINNNEDTNEILPPYTEINDNNYPRIYPEINDESNESDPLMNNNIENQNHINQNHINQNNINQNHINQISLAAPFH